MSNRLLCYSIKQTIGEGATSKVKLVEHKTTKEKFAMKIIKPRQEIQKQIDREIEILQKISTLNQILISQNSNSSNNNSNINPKFDNFNANENKPLKHPNLVNLHEVIKTKDKIYLVLDLVENGDLEKKLEENNGSFTEDESRFYFRQLINAIKYLHTRNITHRDLKLENLLIDNEGNLRLSDFGLSIVQQTDLSTHCGTPYYVAPEIFFNSHYNGPPADVWSCGIVLYIMLTGNFPFEGKDFDELGRKVMKGKIEYPSFLSDEVIDLLKHILNVDPAHRYTVDDIMKHKWFNSNVNAGDRRHHHLAPTDFHSFDDLIIDIDDGLVDNSGSSSTLTSTSTSDFNSNSCSKGSQKNETISSYKSVVITKMDNLDNIEFSHSKSETNTDEEEEEEEEESSSSFNIHKYRPNESVVKIPMTNNNTTTTSNAITTTTTTTNNNTNTTNNNTIEIENTKVEIKVKKEADVASEEMKPLRLSSTSSTENDHIVTSQAEKAIENTTNNDKNVKKGNNNHNNKKKKETVLVLHASQGDAFVAVTDFLTSKKAKIIQQNSSNIKSFHNNHDNDNDDNDDDNDDSFGDETIEATMKFFLTRVKFIVEINKVGDNKTNLVVSKKSGSSFNYKRVLKKLRSRFCSSA